MIPAPTCRSAMAIVAGDCRIGGGPARVQLLWLGPARNLKRGSDPLDRIVRARPIGWGCGTAVPVPARAVGRGPCAECRGLGPLGGWGSGLRPIGVARASGPRRSGGGRAPARRGRRGALAPVAEGSGRTPARRGRRGALTPGAVDNGRAPARRKRRGDSGPHCRLRACGRTPVRRGRRDTLVSGADGDGRAPARRRW
jgi:hypothetical protein